MHFNVSCNKNSLGFMLLHSHQFQSRSEAEMHIEKKENKQQENFGWHINNFVLSHEHFLETCIASSLSSFSHSLLQKSFMLQRSFELQQIELAHSLRLSCAFFISPFFVFTLKTVIYHLSHRYHPHSSAPSPECRSTLSKEIVGGYFSVLFDGKESMSFRGWRD